MSSDSPLLRPSEIAPTTLRLQPPLRDELMRQATLNGRSLSQEIAQRLQASLSAVGTFTPPPAYGAAEAAPAVQKTLSDAHRQLTSLFDTLTPDKQLALLTLLRR